MKQSLVQLLVAVALAGAVNAAEFHVALNGNDSNSGTAAAPLRTIQRAADLAQPGDVITVHEGLYRERVTPPRGGESNDRRIVYQTADGEKVEIRGSEIVKDWAQVQKDVWKVTLPNSFFGSFNPYNDLLHGDWFKDKGRPHHTGAVYLNGEWLAEAAKLDDVLNPAPTTSTVPTTSTTMPTVPAGPLWFAEVDKDTTTIWAQFKGVNPNNQLVEINVRRTVFYPQKPGINYLTVRGFIMRHAATPWAPPTAEQIGVIGTHWSKDWIIENNVISHSICSGIALGKYGDEWDNKSGSAKGYVRTIERALASGWTKDSIGHHIVRNNTISHCEQAGIVGSLGAVFSEITGNTIHDIHVRQLFSGAEMAGIKIHAAIDVQIIRNHVHHTARGLWLDWMAQGTRVSGNLFHDNGDSDLFLEVNHGPFLVDNNLLLSPITLRVWSHGGAYVHNLIGGRIAIHPLDARVTPYHRPHSTEIAGWHDNPSGDDRFYNNLFVGRANAAPYNAAELPVWMDGNVFLGTAKPSTRESDPLVKPELDPAVKLVKDADGLYLHLKLDKSWAGQRPRELVTTDLLGRPAIPSVPYEQPDGTPIRIDTDYFGKKRNESNPTPGPFENPGDGELRLKVR